MDNSNPIWSPSKTQISDSNMMQFARWASEKWDRSLTNSDELHAWSINHLGEFWDSIWDYCGVVGEKGERILANPGKMPGTKFFPDASFNFAENLLKKSDGDTAMIFRGEDKERASISWDELHVLVSKFQQALASAGVGEGDRVAAMMPNMIETIAAMIAVSSIGAIWSSCSPDFGTKGVLDRFGQIEPKVFFACDGYWYNGKRIEIAEKLAEIVPALKTKTVIIPYLGIASDVADNLPDAVSLETFIGSFEAKAVSFVSLPFDHPLYIVFSSGTTGIPKCIVHSQGGILLMHLKEHQLHYGLGDESRFFYFSTCGWMMWNWLASGLASGATLMLYDGSPFAPDGNVLFDYAAEEKFTFFGTSAKFIDAVRNADLNPAITHDLSAVRVITSTGSPLAPENYDFVYSHISPNVHLASISGGTDIAACFVGGDPTKPVYKGEIQASGLGMATEVWNDEGEPVQLEKGELVCVKPFPSMPIGFWNDLDGSKYHDAYFARFDNIWCHGDFAEWTEHGGMVIHGRSDATLNPGGVRIGTAEIYNQVEQLTQVDEALCIGQSWESDVRVVLFVKLAAGVTLDEALTKTIKQKIRTGATPRHVPAKIIAVADIPRTKSGKITELAVRDVVHGRQIKNQEALANPEALALFENLAELA
ncbi:MAG: acetoacetate--CoA ligase [Rhizobiaceae bacterium]